MPNTCFVPNCSTGYHPRKEKKQQSNIEEKEKLSLFAPPKDGELLLKWERAIPRKDKKLSSKDRVCEKHFLKDEIIRFYEHKIFNGDVSRIPRGKPALKCGAIPSIFPNCPSYLSNPTKKRKSPKKRVVEHPVVVPTIPIPTYNEENRIEEVQEVIPNCEEDFSIVDFQAPGWSRSVITELKSVIFIQWTKNHNVAKHVVIDANCKMRFFLDNMEIKVKQTEDWICSSKDMLDRALTFLSEMKPCNAQLRSNEVKSYCQGFVTVNNSVCRACSKTLNNLKKSNGIERNQRKMRYNLARKHIRSTRKIIQLRNILKMQKKCATTDQKKLDRAFKNLPAELPTIQREIISACIQAAQLGNSKNGKKGRRYTTYWIYECLMIKIKSNSMYEYLRRKNILPLPSPSSIYRWLKALKPVYGYQTTTFSLLQKRFAALPAEERRGVILFDEMKVTPYVSLDKDTLKVTGFTDLGKYTPAHQRHLPGDHALVIMIQPFRGSWAQPIAAFLSRGAASGTVLTQIIIEGIVLLENAGFYVDGVVCDGASWNRAMWAQFGVTIDTPYCTHICDDQRNLFFYSDFPHLIKCLRNWVQKMKVFPTSHGKVYVQHWRTLLQYDAEHHGKFGIKLCPRLTSSHLEPKHYDKMNVAMAFQFFGEEVVAAMQSVSRKENSPFDFPIDGTIHFIKTVKELIHSMNSRTSKGALFLNSTEYKVIHDFITYLNDWKIHAEKIGEGAEKERNENEEGESDEDEDDVLGKEVQQTKKKKSKSTNFLTKSTYEGLIVSLKATLLLFDFLVKKCNFKYLMTSRLNQDRLEGFFGMIRSHGGNDSHPTSLIFIQLYRLLSTYALIKPPKGSNIIPAETVETLMKIRNLKKKSNSEEKSHWQFTLDRIVDSGVDISEVEDLFDDDMEALEYFAGYVARKAKKFTDCEFCIESLQTKPQQPTNLSYLNCRNHYDGLVLPSEQLLQTCKAIEHSIQQECGKLNFEISAECLFNISYILHENAKVVLIGCPSPEHRSMLTGSIIKFVSITRLLFICKEVNKTLNNVSRKKGLNKASKY